MYLQLSTLCMGVFISFCVDINLNKVWSRSPISFPDVPFLAQGLAYQHQRNMRIYEKLPFYEYVYINFVINCKWKLQLCCNNYCSKESSFIQLQELFYLFIYSYGTMPTCHKKLKKPLG